MIVSTRFIPKGFVACSLWPFILVKPEERGNVAHLGVCGNVVPGVGELANVRRFCRNRPHQIPDQ